MTVYPVSIDDNDPQVLYSNGWQLITQDGSWTGTMHSTSVVGSSATVRFTGSRVAVVGTIPTGNGSLSEACFSIDNAAPGYMSHATNPLIQWQTVFWDSGPLAFGSHLIVITNLGNQSDFRLDHIDYDPTDGRSPPAFLASSSSSVSTSSTSYNSIPAPSGASNATTANNTPGSISSAAISRPHVATVFSGILGAVLAILLVLALIFFLRRRRNRKGGSASSRASRYRDAAGRSMTPTPYSFNMESAASAANLVAIHANSSSSTYNPLVPVRRPDHLAGSHTPRSFTPDDGYISVSSHGSRTSNSAPVSPSIYTSDDLHGTPQDPQQQQNDTGIWAVAGSSSHAGGVQLPDTPSPIYGSASSGASFLREAPPAYPGRESFIPSLALGELNKAL